MQNLASPAYYSEPHDDQNPYRQPWNDEDEEAPEMLAVIVELMDNDGRIARVFAEAETVEQAVAQAEEQYRTQTGDPDWTMNDWRPA